MKLPKRLILWRPLDKDVDIVVFLSQAELHMGVLGDF